MVDLQPDKYKNGIRQFKDTPCIARFCKKNGILSLKILYLNKVGHFCHPHGQELMSLGLVSRLDYPTKMEGIELNPKEADFDILGDLYDHISEYGVKTTKQGNTILNPNYIKKGNKQIIVNLSLFKNNRQLLNRLMRLPEEGIQDILRITIKPLLYLNLSKKDNSDLSDWDVVVIR